MCPQVESCLPRPLKTQPPAAVMAWRLWDSPNFPQGGACEACRQGGFVQRCSCLGQIPGACALLGVLIFLFSGFALARVGFWRRGLWLFLLP